MRKTFLGLFVAAMVVTGLFVQVANAKSVVKKDNGLIGYINNGRIEGATNLIYKNGFLGVGESYPANNLDVAGSMAIGVDYTMSVAPDNGLKVQGHTLIGSPLDNNSGATLQVTGDVSITKNISLGKKNSPTGITMYDRGNGEAYCLGIRNSQIDILVGECN